MGKVLVDAKQEPPPRPNVDMGGRSVLGCSMAWVGHAVFPP
jgi:hypothetical protein